MNNMKKKIEIEVPEGFQEKLVNDGSKITIEFVKENKEKEVKMREFLLSWLNGCTIQLSEKYPDSVFYKKDDEVVFELYKEKNEEETYFWVHYDKIWSVFYNKFGLNYDETQSFIKNVVEDTLKLGDIIPYRTINGIYGRWETLLNLENKLFNKIIQKIRKL